MTTSRTAAYDRADTTLDAFYTRDAVMQACLDRARGAARTDLPVLILGESGAGKTILAEDFLKFIFKAVLEDRLHHIVTYITNAVVPAEIKKALRG